MTKTPAESEAKSGEAAVAEADDFDVIHFHEACLHLPWTRRLQCATVTTMHGRLDLRDLVPLYREYAEVRAHCSRSSKQARRRRVTCKDATAPLRISSNDRRT